MYNLVIHQMIRERWQFRRECLIIGFVRQAVELHAQYIDTPVMLRFVTLHSFENVACY